MLSYENASHNQLTKVERCGMADEVGTRRYVPKSQEYTVERSDNT